MPEAVESLVRERAIGAASLGDLDREARQPRFIWLMVPAAARRRDHRGNPHILRRATSSSTAATPTTWTTSAGEGAGRKGIHYVDVGTSGGVWGLERGYCMMIGGAEQSVRRLDPDLQDAGARGRATSAHSRTASRLGGTAEQGYLHCGPSGAGHFVKMVHNGIEYGIMAAYAEGLGVFGRPTSASSKPRSTPRRRRCATPSTTSTTSICLTSPRCGGAAA